MNPGELVLIIYGTEYGFSEEVAHKLFDRIAGDELCMEKKLQPRIVNAKDFSLIDFKKEQLLLCILSTTGDGKIMHVLKEYYL